MANDINLPNLVSHLEVQLADTNGIIADAGRQGSSVGAALGESLRQRVAEAVREIPEVEIDGDPTPLDRDLERVRRDLNRLAATRIGVDISVEDALKQFDRLEPHLERLSQAHPNINVRAAVSGARADLQEILEEARHVDDDDVDIDVHVDTDRPVAEMRSLDRVSGLLMRTLGSVGGAAASLGQISALAGAGIPAVAGLVASLENIAPAAFVGVAAILSVASAAAAVKIGTSGIGDALTAAFAPVSGGGGGGSAGAAAKATNAVADAQRNLKDVIAQTALSNQQALRRVTDAQRDLTDAQKAALDAQKALVSAQKDATRQLEDQNNSLVDAKNDEAQAVLDVTDAEKNLAAVTAKGSTATQEDRDKAALQLAKAKQQLVEQSLAVKRLQADTDAANKAGVQGSQTVIDAQQQIASTSRDVADRQRDVSDAQQEVARTAAQGAEAIDKAREALQQAGAAAGGAGGAAGGVDAFAEAMAKLSPSAQAFVREVIKLKPAFDSLKLDVQEHLFAGLAAELDTTAHSLLPVFRKSLDDSATSLNTMAKETAGAARDLADSGLLGRALAGANKGLSNLIPIPARVVTALGEIGVAAAPAFDRLTKAAADGVGKLADKLDKSFSSGGLEKAIDTAVDALGQLIHVGGNVLTIIDHILTPEHAQGGGLIGILDKVTGALAKFTGTKGFQDALSALFTVMSEVGKVAAPLIVQALTDLEPVFTNLGGPAVDLIDALGDGLSPILDALGPLLDSASQAVGALVEAALPLIGTASQIISSLGPDLQPILDDLVKVFEDLAPVVQQVADAFSVGLQPILDDLPQLIGPLADLLSRNLVVALIAISQILIQNAPLLEELGLDFANLLIALGPLIDAFTVLTTKALVKAAPLLLEILVAATRLGTYLADTFSAAVTDIVVPAVRIFTDLLEGKFSAAWREAKTHASDAVGTVVRLLTNLPGAAAAALSPLASKVSAKAVDAANRLTAPISAGVADAVAYVGGLPARMVRALGDLSTLLFKAGRGLLAGLIDGIDSRWADVKNKLSDLTSKLPDWKGPADRDASILTPAGRSVIAGFMAGIDLQVPALRAQLQGLTGQLAGWPQLAGAVPSAGALAASYAGSAAPAQGPTTINLYGTEATPAGVSDALSWRSKVGRR